MVLGISSICNGLGIYAGNLLKKGDFIGEYTGEIISTEDSDESEIRGRIYNASNYNFIFTTTVSKVSFTLII